jgi:hypothetical protein
VALDRQDDKGAAVLRRLARVLHQPYDVLSHRV